MKVNCYKKIKTKRSVGNIITEIYSKLFSVAYDHQDAHYHLTVFVFWLKRTKVTVVVWDVSRWYTGVFSLLRENLPTGTNFIKITLLKGVELMNFLLGTLIQLHYNLDNTFSTLTTYLYFQNHLYSQQWRFEESENCNYYPRILFQSSYEKWDPLAECHRSWPLNSYMNFPILNKYLYFHKIRSQLLPIFFEFGISP